MKKNTCKFKGCKAEKVNENSPDYCPLHSKREVIKVNAIYHKLAAHEKEEILELFLKWANQELEEITKKE